MSDKLAELTEKRAVLESELLLVMAGISAEKKSRSKVSPSKVMLETIKKQTIANNELRARNKKLKHLCAVLLKGNNNTYKSMAEALGVSVATAQKYIDRALFDLRKIEYETKKG